MHRGITRVCVARFGENVAFGNSHQSDSWGQSFVLLQLSCQFGIGCCAKLGCRTCRFGAASWDIQVWNSRFQMYVATRCMVYVAFRSSRLCFVNSNVLFQQNCFCFVQVSIVRAPMSKLQLGSHMRLMPVRVVICLEHDAQKKKHQTSKQTHITCHIHAGPLKQKMHAAVLERQLLLHGLRASFNGERYRKAFRIVLGAW